LGAKNIIHSFVWGLWEFNPIKEEL